MFLPSQIASNVTGGPEYFRMPWEVAPKVLQDAFKNALEKIEATSAAATELQITKDEAEFAKLKWDAQAKELVRADKALPSRDETDRANLKVIIAEENLNTATIAQNEAEHDLGQLLNQDELRAEWREAMQKQLEADQKNLEAKSVEVIRLTERIQQLQSFSTWSGVWPHYGTPEIDQNNYVARTIQEALNAKLWTQPLPAQEAKFQS